MFVCTCLLKFKEFDKGFFFVIVFLFGTDSRIAQYSRIKGNINKSSSIFWDGRSSHLTMEELAISLEWSFYLPPEAISLTLSLV